MTERDLIRRLEKTPVPPPPEDLAARIINDIPAEIELHPEFEHEEHRRRFHRPPVWMAAAAAVTIALTGAVTWELRHERPSVETVLAAKADRNVFGSDDAAGHEVGGRKVEVDESSAEAPALEMKVDQDGGLSEAEPVMAVEAHAPITSRETIGKTRPQSRVTAVGDPIPAGPPTGEYRGQTKEPFQEILHDRAQAEALLRSRKATVLDKNRSRAMVAEPTTTLDGLAKGLSKDLREAEQQVSRFSNEIQVTDEAPVVDLASVVTHFVVGTSEEKIEDKKSKGRRIQPQPSTGGSAEPNDQAYGDVFFEHSGVNPFVDTEDDRLSTFGLDVDTGSFTVVRRYLRDGNLPPRAAIRVEEFVNSFDYGDTPPRKSDFRLIVEGAPSAFAAGEHTYTLRLAVKAREVDAADRPPAVLVFCIDVSGSMNRENRLGLVKKALFELLENLRRDDHVGLVVYGSSGRVLLKPTTDHDEIRRAIDRLQAGGATNAEEGLVLAYDLLRDGDDDGRLRRVILCSDGVANVGRTGPKSILQRIQREADDGIELTTVGFGMGNYNDVLMEQLADKGDGRYAYVDDLSEARRIFVEELTGTLLTLGHDAKAQVEFDPDVVLRWRLLGYENRDIADHLFRDPTVDAGEIGAGHTVTAVYEIKIRPEAARRGRVATLRLRYRPMGETREIELDETLRVSQLATSWEEASPALKLASSVAEFAEILKGAYWARDGDLDDVQRRLRRLEDQGIEDPERFDALVEMVSKARGLRRR